MAVVVSEQYCAPCPVELTVAKKKMSLSGESYEITDGEGQALFKMDGHALSVRDKCNLLDASGNSIVCARKKLPSMHDTWEVSLGDDFNEESKLFTVKKASVVQFKTHLEVFLAGNTNTECPDFTIKGNFFEREAQICQGDSIIAELKRKMGAGDVLLDKHIYCTVVSPDVDQAFIATLVVIMHAIHDD